MSRLLVDGVARSVLYDGFLTQLRRLSPEWAAPRFAYGVVPPSDAGPLDGRASALETQVLGPAPGSATLDLTARFLQVTPAGLDGQLVDQPLERTVTLDVSLADASLRPVRESFRWPGSEARGGSRRAIRGDIEVATEPVDADGVILFKVSARVANTTPMTGGTAWSSRERLARSFVATHLVLHVPGGEFVSLVEPLPGMEDLVATCRTGGLWPVLVGPRGARDTMLAAPLVLSDYPDADSTPAACDRGTDDGALALQVLSLTEDERQALRYGGARARQLSERAHRLVVTQCSPLEGPSQDGRTSDEGWTA